MDDVSTETCSIWELLQKDIRDACSWSGMIFFVHMGAIFLGTAGRGHLFFWCGALYLIARWRFPKSELSRVAVSAETTFLVQHIRIMIVLAPIFLFSGSLPLFKMYTGTANIEGFTLMAAILYALGFLASFCLMAECIVWRSLLNPSAGSFQEPWEQVVAFFRNAVIGICLAIGFLVLDWTWEKLLSDNPVFRWAQDSLAFVLQGLPLPEIIFPASLLLLIIWTIKNQRSWFAVH